MSISEAAQEIKTVEPQTLEAPAEDVELASKATPVDEPLPAPAPEQDVAAFSNSIENSLKIPGLDIGATAKTNFDVDPPVELVSPVKQWSPDWVQYDEYYRPIILNPYRDPVRIVYMYEMTPRIMVVPPLGRMVFEAARYAAYNFTAALLAPVAVAVGTVQALTDIAVGSFFGGGYYPGVGMAAPPPPPPVMRYDNVPVYVNYSNARYEPFRVNRIVDVGDDAQFGERKVLLDGVTPAWGVWSEAGGERTFEVHRTQQFPGLEAPQEGPLPGDYQLKLASDAAPTDGGMSGRDIFLMVSAGVIGTLGFGAIGLAWFLGRRTETGALSLAAVKGAGSAGALSVVDAIHRTVDRGGVVTGEERDRLGDVDRLHEPARGCDAHDQIPVGVLGRGELCRLRGRHPARADGVHADLLLGVLDRQRAGQPDESVFGRAVAGGVDLAFHTCDGRDIDDVAGALQQMWQRGAAQIERSGEVDGQIAFPLVVGHRRRMAHLMEPRDVHQHVEPPEDVDALCDGVAAGVR